MQEQVSSNLLQEIELPTPAGGSERSLGEGSFTTFGLFSGNGTVERLRFTNARINANSRVFVSASEYVTDPATTRFIGSAPIQVLNVAPFNGGVLLWVVIDWGNPINVRFDMLVDP